MIPILIVCYLRPEKLRLLLESLSNSRTEIYIFIDRAEGAHEDVNRQVYDTAMQYVHSLNIKVNWSRQKLGVAHGVPAAINWAFSFVDELVILEDGQTLLRLDLLSSKSRTRHDLKRRILRGWQRSKVIGGGHQQRRRQRQWHGML